MPSFDYPDPGIAADLLYSIQLSLGVLFGAAAVPKLRRPAEFRATVTDFSVLPRLAPAIAVLTIVGELTVSLTFVLGTWVEVGVAVAIALTLMFAGATGVNLVRGRRIDCGCFGGESEEITGKSLVRLGIILSAALALAVGFGAGGVEPISTASVLDAGLDGAAYLVAAAGTALGLLASCFLALNAGDVLAALRRKEVVQ